MNHERKKYAHDLQLIAHCSCHSLPPIPTDKNRNMLLFSLVHTFDIGIMLDMGRPVSEIYMPIKGIYMYLYNNSEH